MDARDETADWAEMTEAKVLDAALVRAANLGWTRELATRAAADCGLSPGDAELLLPHGPRDLAALLSRRHDAEAAVRLAGVDPKSLKIRERIAQAVEARLEAAAVDTPAVRRWAGFMALPRNLPLALRLVWESADRIWRWAGDTATDENHYSKRAILSGILMTALPVRLNQGEEAAREFVAARIENVMAFEKWKAGIKPLDLAREVAHGLARLRYGRA